MQFCILLSLITLKPEVVAHHSRKIAVQRICPATYHFVRVSSYFSVYLTVVVRENDTIALEATALTVRNSYATNWEETILTTSPVSTVMKKF